MTQDTLLHTPSVSVVICTYNGERYIREQLDSILAQTYPITEIIIQDNESTDGTMAILQEYAKAYPIIHVFSHPRFTNIAPTDDATRQIVNDNFFSAIARATSDYIAISDQDDIWLHTKIEEQMSTIGDNWCCFHYSPLFSTMPNYAYSDSRSYNYGLERMLFAGTIVGHTMLIRKSLYDTLMQQVPSTQLHQITNAAFFDCTMSCIALAFNKIVFIPRALSFHRRHPNNASSSKTVRRDLSKRTVTNAIRLVLRNLNPAYRKVIIPIVRRRMTCIGLLLDCFPDAPNQYTHEAYQIIHIYTDKHVPFRNLQFVSWAIRNRNKIFYAAERNQFAAILRAIFLPITVCDAFVGDYERLQHP